MLKLLTFENEMLHIFYQEDLVQIFGHFQLRNMPLNLYVRSQWFLKFVFITILNQYHKWILFRSFLATDKDEFGILKDMEGGDSGFKLVN